MLLLDLPACLASDVLSQWVSWKSVAKVDQAFCSKKDRENWLALLSNQATLFSYELNLTNESCEWILKRNAKMTSVVISMKPSGLIRNAKKFENVLRDIGRAVDSLTLREARDTTTAMYASIAEWIPSIRKLDIDKCCSMDGLRHLLRPTLRSLTVDVGYGIYNNPFTDLSFPNLECFKYTPWMTQPILTEICRHITAAAPGLLEYHVPCDPLALEDATLLATTCPKLVYLECDGCNDEVLVALAAGCRKLRVADFGSYYGAGSGMVALVMACPALRAIRLSTEMLTDESLLAIMKHCPRLVMFNVDRSGGIGLTYAGIGAVLELCPALRSLSLGQLNEGPGNLTPMLAQCGKLHNLELTSRMNDAAAVSAIVTHCTELRRLSMYCGYDGGAVLVPLLQGCAKLTTIVIEDEVGSLDCSSHRSEFWMKAALSLARIAFPKVHVVENVDFKEKCAFRLVVAERRPR